MEKISFRKFEHMILPRFRQKINKAESTEDIKKAFITSSIDLFERVLAGRFQLRYEDVRFLPHKVPYFTLDQRLIKDDYFHLIWKDSDLRFVIGRLAEQAMNHFRHLEKHQEKTNSNPLVCILHRGFQS